MSRAYSFVIDHSHYLVHLTVLQALVLAKQRGAVNNGKGVGTCGVYYAEGRGSLLHKQACSLSQNPVAYLTVRKFALKQRL